jgi:hypothetical protein
MKSGEYWGILLMGKGYWTSGGHYIAISEVKKDKYYVLDPASSRRTGWHKWKDFDGEVKVFYLIEKPSTGILAVDGIWGMGTTRAVQKIFGVKQDGIISRQPMSNASLFHAVSERSWQFLNSGYEGGSAVIKEMQKKFSKGYGYTGDIDGYCGHTTIKALQKFLKTDVSGIMDVKTVKAFQTWLNKKL